MSGTPESGRWRTLLACCLAAFYGCASPGQGLPKLQTVDHVDLKRYAGTWYEIARYPHRFQKGCVASRADYELLPDGKIKVLNQCRKGTPDGALRTATGTARVVDAATNARLEVSFFWPFRGDYWIIDLAPDYSWAVVGHPSREYLWILSRTPVMEESAYRRLISTLPSKGYDPGRLLRSPHTR